MNSCKLVEFSTVLHSRYLQVWPLEKYKEINVDFINIIN